MENNNFWQTERGKALIKLGAWMIFIIALIVFVLVSERNADDNILDDPNNNEVNKYIKGARALIFPSRWYEGAPLTPLEAMRYGVPCLISNVSAAIDYTNNKDRTFCLNANDLEKKIVLYEKNIKESSQEAQTIFKKMTEKSYREEIIKLYKKIVNN